MQIKEFEAYTLKDCLQLVRKDLGPEAVILETRKYRKGGLLGLGAREAVCIVAATGITVQNDLHSGRKERYSPSEAGRSATTAVAEPVRTTTLPPPPTPSQSAAIAAARNAYLRQSSALATRETNTTEERLTTAKSKKRDVEADWEEALSQANRNAESATRAGAAVASGTTQTTTARKRGKIHEAVDEPETERLSSLESAMKEIRDSLMALQREQREVQERTVSAVVSAVAPAVNAISLASNGGLDQEEELRFPELYQRLIQTGVSTELASELIDELPDVAAWKEEAQLPLAEAALRELIAGRVASSGPIKLTPGKLKAVALIGPTGVGKTTTIAKLAAHFALVECKKVGLLTVDTYRIAAVEQLKTYSQIIDIPISVAYSHAEVLPAVEQFADYDLLLIDTAGRSQKNIMQVGELKTLLEALGCETHLVLSAPIKEQDMIEAAQRFSAARVDRLLFSKLDETSTYGTLLNVADRTGIPLSYVTTGQKVPEDIEIVDGGKLANLLLG